MLNLFYPFTLLPFYLLILSSCTERIDIYLRTSEPRLVVDGGISFDTLAHRVVLSTTMPFFSSNDDIPFVSGAHVRITEFDENMEKTGRYFILTEDYPDRKGHYFTDPDVFGKQRHFYRLDISNVNIAGQTHFYALAHFPPIADRIDSIRVVWGEDLLMLMLTGRARNPYARRTGWNVEVFANDPPGKNYYILVLHKNDTALNDTLTRFMLLDNQMINQTEIGLVGLPMAFISDSSWMAVQEGDTVTLEIRGVSADYYRFVREFWDVYGGQNPMFGGAPANVRGNVSGGAIGYFWAHGSRRASDIADRSKESTMEWRDNTREWLPRDWVWRENTNQWTPPDWLWRENTNQWTPPDWLWCEPLGRWMPPALFSIVCR